jgi:acyl-CoA reductase-like NAD-dependent aldehyde dehydrogenase
MYKFNSLIKNVNKSDDFFYVNSPYDGRITGAVEIPRAEDIEKAFFNAENSFRNTMKKMPAFQRAEILYKTSQLIKQNHEELSQLIASEGGKPLKDARIEVTRAINTVKMSGDEALNLNGSQLSLDRAKGSENHLAFTIKEPIGTVLAISAFNHPVNLICHQAATAIAAGNSLIIKPSEKTPLSCFKIAQYLIESGLPEDCISVLPLTGQETEKIIGDNRLRFVSFIGNASVGWKIPKLIAPGVGYALEHGGTATALIDKSADIDNAVISVTKGGYYHAGQVCVSTQNVFVHESKFEEFLSKFNENVIKLKTGDPNDDTIDVGPIITTQKAEEILGQINEAISLGAELILGGELMENNCITPTILTNTNYDMKVMNSEIFGPVVNVNSFNSIDKVIEDCNNTPYAFQNAVYAQDIDVALYFARNIDSKAVIINDSTAFRVDWMPFGGAKEAGFKVGGIKFSINDLVEEKLIIIKQKLL